MQELTITKKDNGFILGPVIAISCFLDEPSSFKDGDTKKWSMKVIIPKDRKDVVDTIHKWAEKLVLANNTWPDKKKKSILTTVKSLTDQYSIVKDGDRWRQKQEDEGWTTTDSIKKHFVLTLKRKESDGRPVLALDIKDEETGHPKLVPEIAIRGTFVQNAPVNVWFSGYTYTQGTGGLTLKLEGVQRLTKIPQACPFDIVDDDEINYDEDIDL